MQLEKLLFYKKPAFEVSSGFRYYLNRYNRLIEIPIFYEDLLRFETAVSVYDSKERDTLWVRVVYPELEREEIDKSLKQIYSNLHSDGNEEIIKYLSVDAVDFCTFGNSKPFRVKVRNILNDNYTYFYVKKTDASRLYGLELEHLLSPYNLNFLVYEGTLIEEHISGIPGDIFIEEYLPQLSKSQQNQLAKEFVKFNERSMIRLLGDMRSYNYVVIPVHDFDSVIHKIRPIDFDQQFYEGNLKVYRPQFFEENKSMVNLIKKFLLKDSIDQYKREERSILAKRALSNETQLRRLMEICKLDIVSDSTRTAALGQEIYNLTKDSYFKSCKTMGQILSGSLSFVTKNYKDLNWGI
tara:strand:- start:6622 stop:7680 length:1059 start_codon:yes stop_codon:yes gene_type:complete